MAGAGAIPATALSNTAGRMPWARALARAFARKVSKWAWPEVKRGGATGTDTTGAAGGVGLGAVVAQATATRVPHKAARRCRPDRDRRKRVMAYGYTHFADFWRKTAIFC